MNFKIILFAHIGHNVNEIVKGHADIVNVNQHDHYKIILKNGLRNVSYVYVIICANVSCFCYYTDVVLSCYTDYCLHKFNSLIKFLMKLLECLTITDFLRIGLSNLSFFYLLYFLNSDKVDIINGKPVNDLLC